MASPHIYHHPLSPFPVIGSIKACRGHLLHTTNIEGGGGGGWGDISTYFGSFYWNQGGGGFEKILRELQMLDWGERTRSREDWGDGRQTKVASFTTRPVLTSRGKKRTARHSPWKNPEGNEHRDIAVLKSDVRDSSTLRTLRLRSLRDSQQSIWVTCVKPLKTHLGYLRDNLANRTGNVSNNSLDFTSIM